MTKTTNTLPLLRKVSQLIFVAWIAALVLVWSPKAEAAKVFAQVGPGFIFADGSLPGVSASFLGRVTSNGPAFVGLDTGVFFATGAPSFTMAIPLVPYLVYFFPSRDLFKPWIGFGFGALLGFGSSASTDFVIFFKPGARVSVNRQVDIFFEPRLGLVGATLAFAPVLGAMFSL